jgi:hypothetical protein
MSEGHAVTIEHVRTSSTADNHQDRIAALEAKVEELDALVNLALRLLAVEKPVSALLERYGATEAEDLAIHALLDDVAKRAEQGGLYAPSFGGFVNDLAERFPSVRGNRQFVSLLLETLKLDRPAYRDLHTFMTVHRWSQGT